MMDYQSKIQNSIDYIENNLSEELKLNDIAKQSYFSGFYFHKLFRKFTGTSVMEYVRNRRLAEAASDLVKTGEKITDIAFKYQFSSEESFSRAFKRIYGMSPRKYRTINSIVSYNENERKLYKFQKRYSSNGTTLSMAA